jgi:hypothetical protein
MIRIWRDPRAGYERSVLVGIDACVHALTPADARKLRDELDGALAEEVTRRDTPLAIAAVRDTDPAPRRPSSTSTPAVRVCPECGRPRRTPGDCEAAFHTLGTTGSLPETIAEIFDDAKKKP